MTYFIKYLERDRKEEEDISPLLLFPGSTSSFCLLAKNKSELSSN